MHFTFNGRNFDGSGFSDFFETLFGGGQFGGFGAAGGRGGSGAGGFGPDPFGGFSQRSRRGRDVEAELALSLEEVLRGGRRSVTVPGQRGPRTLEVNVPQGIREGAKLRLAGQGDSVPGGQPGDLFLRVRYLPHAIFRVDGDDVHCDVPVAPWEAALGAKVEIPTLEGHVEMQIPAGSSSGRKFRLRGKGLGAPGRRGDLLAKVMVRVPPQPSDAERELWEKLAAASPFKARA